MATVDVSGRPVGLLERAGGPSTPLLLVHGYTGEKEDFAGVIDALAADRRVVAVDLPGHGETPGPDDLAAYGLGALGAWVLHVADAVGLGDVHLLGHSMGGLVAQRVAATSAHRLRSLVLQNTGPGGLRDEAADHLSAVAAVARDHGLEAARDYAEAAGRARGLPEGDPDVAAYMRARYLRLAPAAVLGGARAILTAMPVGAPLRGLDIPALVLWGEADDVWLPSEQRRLAAGVPGAEVVVIPGAAHSPQREQPERWLAAVTDFLRRADLGRARATRRRRRAPSA